MTFDDLLTPEDWTKLVEVSPGVVVERDVLDIVDWVRNYAPGLDVLYLEGLAKVGQPPFKIVERCFDGKVRVVLDCWTLDESVKARIYAADTQRIDIEAAIQKNNDKIRADDKKAHGDRMAEAADIGKHLITNPKTSYTLTNTKGELVKIDDHLGVVKRDGKDAT